MLIALVQTLRGKIDQHRWVLKMALWSFRIMVGCGSLPLLVMLIALVAVDCD
ncbi:cytochrome bd-II oxidase subunit I [Shigella sonnei]|nr:cytochrome bd-II oxidase subunit I [Shigella sonnei]